ncbi:MAG: DUF4255 domain-containing protein [Methanosarcinales archaeon]|nr:DUF4255 domain-containing protein [Methanosarcinales archaeon]
MSDYTAIADVGETLIDLLRVKMEDLIPNDSSIVLVSPGEIQANDTIRLSLFLYQVSENVHMRNQELQIFDPATLNYPPITLDLFYMLTSYPSSGISDVTERTKEEHSILGRAVQVLYENAIIAGTALKGNLSEKYDELHITMSHLSLDDITKIWNTFQDKPFRPSVCYLVTPVMIDSTRMMSTQRVVLQEKNYTHMRTK